jgi:hypothetical protein
MYNVKMVASTGNTTMYFDKKQELKKCEWENKR